MLFYYSSFEFTNVDFSIVDKTTFEKESKLFVRLIIKQLFK